jgi:hypothetical protein
MEAVNAAFGSISSFVVATHAVAGWGTCVPNLLCCHLGIEFALLSSWYWKHLESLSEARIA